MSRTWDIRLQGIIPDEARITSRDKLQVAEVRNIITMCKRTG